MRYIAGKPEDAIHPFRAEQAVEIRWEGDAWLPATIHRAYDYGADCIVGSRGCHYIQFEDIREVR